MQNQHLFVVCENANKTERKLIKLDIHTLSQTPIITTNSKIQLLEFKKQLIVVLAVKEQTEIHSYNYESEKLTNIGELMPSHVLSKRLAKVFKHSTKDNVICLAQFTNVTNYQMTISLIDVTTGSLLGTYQTNENYSTSHMFFIDKYLVGLDGTSSYYYREGPLFKIVDLSDKEFKTITSASYAHFEHCEYDKERGYILIPTPRSLMVMLLQYSTVNQEKLNAIGMIKNILHFGKKAGGVPIKINCKSLPYHYLLSTGDTLEWINLDTSKSRSYTHRGLEAHVIYDDGQPDVTIVGSTQCELGLYKWNDCECKLTEWKKLGKLPYKPIKVVVATGMHPLPIALKKKLDVAAVTDLTVCFS